MKKYPHTKEGMVHRRRATEAQVSKHAPAKQFNPANGEPHTKKWLDHERAAGRRRRRA